MKGRITKDGALEIMRGRKWKPQYCLHSQNNPVSDRACGDWCPLFGEPEQACRRIIDEMNLVTAVPLCTKMIFFTDFTDEREKKDEKTCGNCENVDSGCRPALNSEAGLCKNWTPKKERQVQG